MKGESWEKEDRGGDGGRQLGTPIALARVAAPGDTRGGHEFVRKGWSGCRF